MLTCKYREGCATGMREVWLCNTGVLGCSNRFVLVLERVLAHSKWKRSHRINQACSLKKPAKQIPERRMFSGHRWGLPDILSKSLRSASAKLRRPWQNRARIAVRRRVYHADPPYKPIEPSKFLFSSHFFYHLTFSNSSSI